MAGTSSSTTISSTPVELALQVADDSAAASDVLAAVHAEHERSLPSVLEQRHREELGRLRAAYEVRLRELAAWLDADYVAEP